MGWMRQGQGEMQGLPWNQAGLTEAAVTFLQDLDRSRGGAEFDDTKAGSSDRTVLIPRWLADRLQALRAQQLARRLQSGPCPEGMPVGTHTASIGMTGT